MSEPIKVGDLVWIVRHHDCNPKKGYGVIFTVENISPSYNFSCRFCHADLSDGRLLVASTISVGYGYHPLEWVKRIPPLSELEGEKRDEEITA